MSSIMPIPAFADTHSGSSRHRFRSAADNGSEALRTVLDPLPQSHLILSEANYFDEGVSAGFTDQQT